MASFRVWSFCEEDLSTCADKDMRVGESALEQLFQPLRGYVSKVARQNLPSPHSELLLGMTLGINDLKKIPSFTEDLRRSGTIHVVVVSGYNISLVFELIIKLIGSKYKLRNLLIAQVVTFFYALLSGFDPPVIRSWIMGSIIVWGKYYGRSIAALRVLIFSAFVMVAITPAFLFSLSFQLSFLATLSLVLYSDFFAKFSKIEDLIATLAAQVLVWPLISYRFGTFSILSPVVNMLILWTVPLATVLGGATLGVASLERIAMRPYDVPRLQLHHILWYGTYAPLGIFTDVVKFFSRIPWASIALELSLPALVSYYVLVLGATFVLKRNQCEK